MIALCITGGVAASPLSAQGAASDCEALTGTEQVACLRGVIAAAQEALERAEQEMTATPGAKSELGAEAGEGFPNSATSRTTPSSLGTEQVARRTNAPRAEEQRERLLAMIVSSQRVYPNRLQVHLEDGQIWQQIQGDTQIVELDRNASVPAEIWPSGLGGYRMRLPSIGRVLKVERLR